MPGKAPTYELYQDKTEPTIFKIMDQQYITERVETSSLMFSDAQMERAGIELGLNMEDQSVRLAICDVFTGNVGCNTSVSLDLHPAKVLELIDKLYIMLGYLEEGEIIEGQLYPHADEFRMEE